MGRRQETTEYLKECMSNALLEQLKDKPFDKIGLKEITEAAGVGRVTYYRHFNNKTELITYKLNITWNRWLDENPIPGKESSVESRWFFDFFYVHRDLFTILKQNNLEVYIYSFILNLFDEPNFKNKLFKLGSQTDSRFYISFLTYGILGVLTEWINDGFSESTDDMLDTFEKFQPHAFPDNIM